MHSRHRQRLSAWTSCAICVWASSMCWWASTCCARAWTCPRSRWWPSSTPTRRASCATTARLIQTIGRAARNVYGQVIMYADQHHRLHGPGHHRNAAPSRTSRWPTTRSTASSPKPSARPSTTSWATWMREVGSRAAEQVNTRAGRAVARGGAAHYRLAWRKTWRRRPQPWTSKRRPACATRWCALRASVEGDSEADVLEGPEEERPQGQRLRQPQERGVRQLASVVEPCCPSTVG